MFNIPCLWRISDYDLRCESLVSEISEISGFSCDYVRNYAMEWSETSTMKHIEVLGIMYNRVRMNGNFMVPNNPFIWVIE